MFWNDRLECVPIICRTIEHSLSITIEIHSWRMENLSDMLLGHFIIFEPFHKNGERSWKRWEQAAWMLLICEYLIKSQYTRRVVRIYGKERQLKLKQISVTFNGHFTIQKIMFMISMASQILVMWLRLLRKPVCMWFYVLVRIFVLK